MLEDGTLQIIIAPDRYHYVGFTVREGEHVVIRRAYNIRRWGTTAGLGQLAEQGPKPNTVLDNYGTVRIPYMLVQHVDCNPMNWASVYK